MNEIQSEIKFYEKLMSKYADGCRRAVKTGSGSTQNGYSMAAMPVGITADHEKRFGEIVKVWKEINGWRVYDPDRAKELRSRISKMEVR